MIRYLGLLSIFIWTLSACQKDNKENNLADFQKEAAEIRKKQINFDLNATPKYFSAKTLRGTTFNSKDFEGKNLMLFIYPKSYLTKSDSYDMPTELNDIYNQYKTKWTLLGLLMVI